MKTTRVLLLAYATWGFCALPAAAEDLGALARTATLSATVWLQPHDAAAFDAAVAARQTRGDPLYHRWMTRAELASYAASDTAARSAAAALTAAGLRITGTTEDHAGISVQADAGHMQAAFGTALHMFRGADGVTYRGPVGDVVFQGAHAAMIAAVTGLSSRHLAPNFRRAEFAGRAALAPASGSLADQFTNRCFLKQDIFAQRETTSFANPNVVVAMKIAGPQYTATGLDHNKACGYTPAQVIAHYGLTGLRAQGLQGQGQTIVIVDAYGSPSILADANAFNTAFKLKALDSSNFSVIYPAGTTSADPYLTGWPTEIALDVEWAHAMAPEAKIVLVVAANDDDTNLVYALNYAAVHGLGDVISNSYGEAEAGTGAATARAFDMAVKKAAAQGIAVNVSTGDDGDFGLGTPAGAASIPADSPYATAVGGTSLDVPTDRGPVDTAWGTNLTALMDADGIDTPPHVVGFRQGGGGGESNFFEKPTWQGRAGVPGVGRQLPDIAAIADPYTGVPTIVSQEISTGGLRQVVAPLGGTSLATPVFSGFWALAQQKAGQRLGQAAPIIAAMPAGAVTDIQPISAARSSVFEHLNVAGTNSSYSPSQLLGTSYAASPYFVGIDTRFRASVNADNQLFVFDITFGADSSLLAGTGWDDATGFGVPNGAAFIAAAAAAAK